MKLLMLGLPEHGKTTFLCALWHVLETGAEPDARLATLPAEAEYLTELRARWLPCEPMLRTEGETPRAVALAIEVSGRPINLDIPDMSGEVIQRAWGQIDLPAPFHSL